MNIMEDELKAKAVDGMYAVAFELMNRCRFAKAATVLRAMLVAAPRDERGWVALGVCHEHADQWDVAREVYASGRIFAPESVRLSVALARALRCGQENLDVRERLLEEATQRAIESADTRLVDLVTTERSAA